MKQKELGKARNTKATDPSLARRRVARRLRVKDAFGAACTHCDAVFTNLSPWHWRKSQYLHESGTGHKMKLFAIQ